MRLTAHALSTFASLIVPLVLTAPAAAQAELILQSGSAAISGSGTQTTGRGHRFSGGAGPATTDYAQVEAHNASIVTLSGGGQAGYLFTYDAARANISGGAVNLTQANGHSTTYVTGGAVSELEVFDQAAGDILGGAVSGIKTGGGTVNVYGGDIGVGPGGMGFYMEGGVVNVYGSGLTLNAGGYDPLLRHDYSDITGRLADGTPISARYFVYAPGTLNLISVPEPASWVGLSIGGLGLLSLSLRARRRKFTAC